MWFSTNGDNAVVGAVVQLKDTKTLQIRSFITQDKGEYHFAGLSTNIDYELKADHDGASSGYEEPECVRQPQTRHH